MISVDDKKKAVELLKRCRLKGVDIAQDCGIKPTTLSNYKREYCLPTVENTKKLLDYFQNISPELMSEELSFEQVSEYGSTEPGNLKMILKDKDDQIAHLRAENAKLIETINKLIEQK